VKREEERQKEGQREFYIRYTMIILYSIVFRVIVQSSLKIFEVMNHRTIVFVI